MWRAQQGCSGIKFNTNSGAESCLTLKHMLQVPIETEALGMKHLTYIYLFE